MFEAASRLKLRFQHKGLCTTEDLWDLSLKSLDSIFKNLNMESKAQKEESLLDTKDKFDTVLGLKINIIRHIVAAKIQARDEQKNAADKAEKKEKLLAIISQKQDAALHDMSIEDLTKLVQGL